LYYKLVNKNKLKSKKKHTYTHKLNIRAKAPKNNNTKIKQSSRKRKNHENSNISPCKKYNFQKNPLKKKPKNPSRYYNSVTDLKFQHKPKYHVSKILI